METIQEKKQENLELKQDSSQPIEKSCTFFIVPFYFDTEPAVPEPKEQKPMSWVKDTEKISNEGEDGDVLYPYIMNFLQGQMVDNSGSQDHLDIYRLNVNEDSDWYKDFWNPLVNYNNVVCVPDGEESRTINFKILSDKKAGFMAPHLFIYNSARIGILTFSVSLEKKLCMGDLKLLNYHLHKLMPTCRCENTKLCIPPKRKFNSEEEKKSAEDKLIKVRTYIPPYDEKEEYSPYAQFSWDMKGFLDLLLADVNHTLFSNIRMHVFTYCQIDDSKEEKLTEQDLTPDLLRLSRCVNDKYLLPFSQLEKEEATKKSFENIYYASSIEGTAIVAVAKVANKSFVSQMHGNIRQRYLWLYMLALIQRYTLLNLNRQLRAVDAEKNDEKLWSLINVLKSVKIRCYYTEVSPYTQHGQFYRLCCQNLHIREAFTEIEEKTSALNMTMSHELQELLATQKEMAEKGQRRLNVLVGILTVVQAAGVIAEFYDNICCRIWATVITVVVGIILILIVTNWNKTVNRSSKITDKH